MTKTFYDLLGVSSTASPEEIKKAFRKLALQHHPDMNSASNSSDEIFKKISEAYKILSDPERRFTYDSSLQKTATPPVPTAPSGTKKRTAPAQKSTSTGRHLAYHLNISLEDIVRGIEKTISYMRTFEGRREQTSVSLHIPAGTANGQKLRLRNAGDSGSKLEKPGDLIVHIHYADHPYFKILDSDVLMTVPVSALQWLLKSPIEIPTLYGIKVIPMPSQDEFGNITTELPQYGLPIKGDIKNRGDFFITMKVQSPADIDDSTRKEIMKLSKIWPKTKDELMFEEFIKNVKKSN